MLCPSCGSRVDDGVWLCPFCEHILDPSVLGVDEDDEPPVRAERTKIVSFIPGPSEPAPEAMILGDVDVSASEFSVVQGPGAQPNGRTSTFLFYTSGATSRIMHPDAVPERTHRDASVPRTPYEDFILACIDGKRSVRAIQRASGLAPQEVVITLLTLLDKGVIHIEPTTRPTSSVEPASAEPAEPDEPAPSAEPTTTDEDGDARGTEELDTGDVDDDEPPDFGAESEATVDAFSALAREEARGRAIVREVDDEPRDEPATDDGAGIDDEAFDDDALGAGDDRDDVDRDDLDLREDDEAGYADEDDEDEGEVLRRAREDSVEADLGRAGDDEGVTGEIELAELQKLSKAPAEAQATDDLPEDDLLSKPLEKSDRIAPKPLLPRRRKTSAARRWGAPAPSAMPLDADELVEREDEPPVMPQALDEGDSEMITDHSSPLRAKPSARPLPKASTVRPARPPSLPTREVDKNDPRPSRIERPLHEEPRREAPKRETPRNEEPRRETPKREEPRAARAATPRPDRTPPPRIRHATGEAPSPMLREPTRPPELPRGKSAKLASTPPPMLLDPEFLVEVPKSIVVPRPEALERDTPPPSKIEKASSLDGLLPPLVEPQPMDAPPGEDDDDELPAAPISASPELARGEDKRRVLEQAMKRGPIEERDRRKPAGADLGRKRKSDEPEEPPVVEPRAVEPRSEKKLEAIARVPPAQRPAPGPAVSGVNVAPAISVAPAAKAPDRPSRDAKPAPSHVDVVRMAKAQKLFDVALKDKADGNLVSARMNMKLALTFDPTNELYQQAFEELSKAAGGSGGGGGSPGMHRSKARELYDQATRAEEVGDVDEAVELLEKALGESKEAAFYNRLGVILAMKKKEFARAQQLIETALELAPGNATYQHNLRKVLSMAAAEDVANRQSGGKKAGLLGFLGRKK